MAAQQRNAAFWGLSFVLALLLGVGGPVSANAADESEETQQVQFLSAHQRFPVLSYNEFMRLTPEAQADYILVMRDFMVDLSRIAPNGLPNTAHNKWEMLLHYLGIEAVQEAQADVNQGCELRRITVAGSMEMQLYCPGKNGISDTIKVTTGAYGTPEDIAQRLEAQMKAPSYRGPTVNLSANSLASQIRTYEADGYYGTLPFNAPIKYPENRVTKTISLPTQSLPVAVDLPADTKVEKPAASEPLQTIKRTDANGDVVEMASNSKTDLDKIGTGQNADITDISGQKRKPTFREAEEASMKKLKKLEDDHKGPLRCIYAGFAIKKTPDNDSCEPVGSFMSEKSKKVFACKNEDVSDAHKKAGGPVIVPKKTPGGKVVLCNPLVFGLDKDGAPFCVPRNKKATESCRFVSSKSSQKDASIKSAVELARENPMVISQIRWTYERLCQGNDEDIKSLLGGSSDAQLKKSKADLAQTCAAYEQKLGEFPNGGRLGGLGSGQK